MTIWNILQKNVTLQSKHRLQMTLNEFERIQRAIEEAGVMVTIRQKGLTVMNKNLVSPHFVLTLCHQGSAKMMYDMTEWNYGKNELAVLTPGHVLNQLQCSDDFVFTRVVLSNKALADLRTNFFISHHDRFALSPKCLLTDEQIEQLENVAKILKALTEFNTDELPMRHLAIFGQLAVGYDFVDIYTRRQSLRDNGSHNSGIFFHFSKLVVEHFHESREVQFYADMLHYTPRNLTRAICKETGGLSPAEWIEQYVILRTKRLIAINKHKNLQEIAFMMGFPDPSSFYRYFKKATGITAKEYRESLGD